MENNNVSQIRDLINKLNYYTKKYDEGNPEISDFEWDNLYFLLQKLEKQTNTYYEDSPTQKINYQVVNKLNKVKHNHLMLSLEKTKDLNEVSDFLKNSDWIAMLKMDGLTCSLRYIDGFLVSAETRGDGVIGEDILHNILQVKNVPKKINYKNELIIDGEIICTYKNFDNFKEEYKNPRNFASGSIRLLDSKDCSERNLTFVAWDIINKVTDEEDYLSKKLTFLELLNFTTVPFIRGSKSSSLDFDEVINRLKEIAREMSYPIDGVVFKIDNIKEYISKGRTDHHFKGGLAYKFYDEMYDTKLIDVEWTMGRTGILTPVAIFEPIEIDGTKISRASLHNVSIMKKTLHKDIICCGWKGQKIQVFKANQIIPQIGWAEEDIDGLTKSYIDFPHICPVCGGNVEVVENLDSNTQVLVCKNPKCEGKLINKLEYMLGKRGLDAKGISKATLEKLIEWGWIKRLQDVFELQQYEKEWKNIRGFGEKSVSNILQSISECTNSNIESVISAAGIPLIGRSIAKTLSKRFSSYDTFKEAVNGSFNFSEIDGFGFEMNKSLKTFDYSEIDFIVKKYLKITNNIIDDNKNTNKLKNLIFCITGKLNKYKNREELVRKIEENGGKTVSSMSKKVNYLINNDINSQSSKNVYAKNNNIEILTEEELDKKFFMD